ncbi:hypothetical protein EWM64_g9730 [Hericium alpestre]|uniref:Uncharacterized protein n=1 Tax=Hericium alpestre TaxID=135208 RepID=A0A4Y9ZI15_9AGAM|nr:hypothetical protein EWM64_g9730 [Hericium alpestre]
MANNLASYELDDEEATRPDKYKFEVLWTRGDARQDPTAGITAANPSRFPLSKCIWHPPDGKAITTSELEIIRMSGESVARMLQALPMSRDPRAANSPARGLRYYKKYFREEYDGHWKATAVLSGSLKPGRSSSFGQDSEEEEDKEEEEDEDELASPPAAEPPARRPRSTSQQKRRRDDSRSSTARQKVSKMALSSDVTSDSQEISTRTEPTASSSTAGNGGLAVSKVAQQLHEVDTLNFSALNTTANHLSAPIDISIIEVDPSADNLLAIISQDYPSIPFANDLLSAMQKGSPHPISEPSDDMIHYIHRVETADPNNSDLSEDDTDAGWGHYQYTTGGCTASTVLTTWQAIGSIATACRLIAVAIKTCKVARHLCFVHQVNATSFLSDAYLAEIVAQLWVLWKSVHEITPAQAQAEESMRLLAQPSITITTPGGSDTCHPQMQMVSTPTAPRIRVESLLSPEPHTPTPLSDSHGGGSMQSNMPSSSPHGSPTSGNAADVFGSPCANKAMLLALTVSDLKKWISEHIPGFVCKPRCKKDDLIDAILAAPESARPNKKDIDSMKAEQKAKGKKTVHKA